jgi:hypothetical protein
VDDKQREAEARKVVAELAEQMKIAQKALDKLNELLIDETERELKKIHAEQGP